MSLLDPRQFLLPAFYLDPSTQAFLTQAVSNHKLGTASSFRISDILEPSPNNSTYSHDLDPSPQSVRSDLSTSPRASSPDRNSPMSKKSRKARTIFTDKQLQELENTFEKQKYLSVQDRMDLAHRMGLSDTQVKTWYQNRRHWRCSMRIFDVMTCLINESIIIIISVAEGRRRRRLHQNFIPAFSIRLEESGRFQRDAFEIYPCIPKRFHVFIVKWKRQATSGMDLLSEPGNLSAVQNLIRSSPYWANYITALPMGGQMGQMPMMGLPMPMIVPPAQHFQATSSSNSPSTHKSSESPQLDVSSNSD